MQVHYNEGLAIHIDPESCAVTREGVGEALTGDRIGQAIEPRKPSSRVPTLFCLRKATWTGASARVPVRPGVVEDLGMCGRSLCGNWEISRLASGAFPSAVLVRIGKVRSRSR